MKRILRASVVSLAGAVAACGATASPSPAPAAAAPAPSATDTTAPPAPPPPDHGAPSTTFPAFPPDMPTLQNHGGHVLANPVVVTVTFPGDTNADAYEQLGDTIGATSYWKTVTGEYGVGPITSGPSNHVRVPTTPAIVTTDPNNDPVEQIADWLVTQLSDTATSHFPDPTDQSIYAIYMSGQATKAPAGSTTRSPSPASR
jgi:hypothetical protein